MKRAYIHRAGLILANTLPLTSLSGTLRTAANLGAQILGSVGWPSSHSAKSTSGYKAHYLKDELVSWHEWMLEDPADVSSSSKRHRTHGACIARKLSYASTSSTWPSVMQCSMAPPCQPISDGGTGALDLD